MRILYAIPDGIDLGGIITATEAHLAGLREIGHDVKFVRFRDTQSRGTDRVRNKKGYDHDQWSVGEGSQLPMHPLLGWAGPYLSMNDESDISEFLVEARSYDLIIWGFLFGFKNANTMPDPKWRRLLDTPDAPAITILHDDHLWDRQAWIANLDGHAIKGWACVHHCSYHLSEGLRSPRALIFNGHDVSGLVDRKFKKYSQRKCLYSVQNAKPWKKVDKYVGMSRYLMEGLDGARLAGDGIELRYMRSKDKCKPQYMEDGRPIWDLAMASGRFDYVGPVGEAKRSHDMSRAKFLCDFSTRQNKGMFNRVFVEAAMQGCITLANPKFMSGVGGEALDLLRPGEHYLPVDTTATHYQIATQIYEHHRSMTDKKYAEMQESLRHLCLKQFDRRNIADKLVRLGMGKPAGYCGDAVGEASGELYYDSGGRRDEAKAKLAYEDMMKHFGQAYHTREG